MGDMKGSRFKKGDEVLINPEVTQMEEWVKGQVIEIQNNPFVGIVVVVETEEGDVFFEREFMFKNVNEEDVCNCI